MLWIWPSYRWLQYYFLLMFYTSTFWYYVLILCFTIMFTIFFTRICYYYFLLVFLLVTSRQYLSILDLGSPLLNIFDFQLQYWGRKSTFENSNVELGATFTLRTKKSQYPTLLIDKLKIENFQKWTCATSILDFWSNIGPGNVQ